MAILSRSNVPGISKLGSGRVARVSTRIYAKALSAEIRKRTKDLAVRVYHEVAAILELGYRQGGTGVRVKGNLIKARHFWMVESSCSRNSGRVNFPHD